MKSMLRILLSATFVSLLSADVLAEPTAQINSYGIYEYKAKLSVMPGTDSSAGTTDNAVLLKKTSEIPRQLGTIFGFFWTVSGYEGGAPLKVTYRLKHPAMQMPNGSTSFGSDDTFLIHPADSTYEMASAFHFSETYELVSGHWEMIVFINDQEVASKSFTIL